MYGMRMRYCDYMHKFVHSRLNQQLHHTCVICLLKQHKVKRLWFVETVMVWSKMCENVI